MNKKDVSEELRLSSLFFFFAKAVAMKQCKVTI